MLFHVRTDSEHSLTHASSSTTTIIGMWLASGTVPIVAATEICNERASKPRTCKLSSVKQALQWCVNSYISKHQLKIEYFTEYLEYSKGNERNVHKIKAFGKAISALNSLPFQVQRIQDVEKVRHPLIPNERRMSLSWCYKIAGIGPGIKRRIEEVLVDQEERGVSQSQYLRLSVHHIWH